MLASLGQWLGVVDDLVIDEIRYLGDVYTAPTIQDLQSLLQSGFRPEKAYILSVVDVARQGAHAVLLDSDGKSVVLRGGLTSGYGGEGPRGLAWVIELLEEVECYPVDVSVSRQVLHRARTCNLRSTDLDAIRNRLPTAGVDNYRVPPREGRKGIWDGSPCSLPFRLLDPRLLPIAMGFDENPDRAIFEGFRRLEHILRTRLDRGSDADSGRENTRVAAMAFAGKVPALSWPSVSEKDAAERFKLFDSAFALFRNPRAHREDAAAEHTFEQFMNLNLLFKYEAKAISPPPADNV